MKIPEIQGNLLSGGEKAVKAVNYILNNGIIETSVYEQNHVIFSVNDKRIDMLLDYNVLEVITDIINKLKNVGIKVYQLDDSMGKDIGALNYSRRKDILQKRKKEKIKESQVVLMNCMKHTFEIPSKVTEQQIKEFEQFLREYHIFAYNQFQGIKTNYKVIEV